MKSTIGNKAVGFAFIGSLFCTAHTKLHALTDLNVDLNGCCFCQPAADRGDWVRKGRAEWVRRCRSACFYINNSAGATKQARVWSFKRNPPPMVIRLPQISGTIPERRPACIRSRNEIVSANK